MKRLVSLVLVVIMLLCSGIFAFAEIDAVTLADGIDALNSQFAQGKGPKTNGYEIDYHYFSPVKEGDTQKYPLVIWLHGMGDGGNPGKQVEKSQIGYWSSQEFQSRFGDAQGAFIFAPRSLEERLMYWDDALIYPLRAAIDSFIEENAENIDISKIYIGGYSMGGKMTLKMAVAYPDMFAAIAPCCGGGMPWNASVLRMPVWAFHGAQDNVVYPYETENMICKMEQADLTPKLTIYPECGHGSWEKAYSEELLEWLLGQRRGEKRWLS